MTLGVFAQTEVHCGCMDNESTSLSLAVAEERATTAELDPARLPHQRSLQPLSRSALVKTWRTATAALGLCWIVAQVVVPLRKGFADPAATSADFSWDMFTRKRVCTSHRLSRQRHERRAAADQRHGRGTQWQPRRRLQHRDRLRSYLRWQCGVVCARYGAEVELTAVIECRDGPPYSPLLSLVEPGNACAALP